MPPQPINLANQLARFSDLWSPKILAQVNDAHFKLVKFQGEFVWHRHDDTDEVFLVLSGNMTIDFREGPVEVQTGEMIVVPRGVEHKPVAEAECHALLIERAGTVNTGTAPDQESSTSGEWI